jgi:hypothetical protein
VTRKPRVVTFRLDQATWDFMRALVPYTRYRNASPPSCTHDRKAASNASSLLALVMTIRCPIARAASSICCSWSAAGGKSGLISTPIRATPGTRSRSSPSRFGSIRLVNRVTPVTLPPGRLKLSTKPALTGSPPIPNTIGIVVVAAFAASPEGSPPAATMTATCRPTRSAASAGKRL